MKPIKKGLYTDDMAQVFTSIPLWIRAEVERVAKRDYLTPSAIYRRLILQRFKQIEEEGGL